MKSLTTTLLLMFFTASPVWAQQAEVRSSLKEETSSFEDLGAHINPQLGISSFEYSGHTGGAHQMPSGGATVELGGSARKLETGILYLQTSADTVLQDYSQKQVTSRYVAIPMMAKLRIIGRYSQSWYAKFGGMTAFRVGGTDSEVSRGVDVLASGGVGGRFVFTPKTDFIVEATYNRGLIDMVNSSHGTNYNQGFLVMAGLSFAL